MVAAELTHNDIDRISRDISFLESAAHGVKGIAEALEFAMVAEDSEVCDLTREFCANGIILGNMVSALKVVGEAASLRAYDLGVKLDALVEQQAAKAEKPKEGAEE